MKDILFRLVDLQDASLDETQLLKKEKVVFRRAIAPEKHFISACKCEYLLKFDW